MRRFKKLLFAIIVCLVLLITACDSENEQEILNTVVETVNEQNEKLDAPSNIPQGYYYIPDEQTAFQMEDFELLTEVAQKARVSKQEIQQELNWFLRLLRTYYGGYGKFGGDVAFEKAVDNILNEIGETEEIGYTEYCELLEKHFSFVTDNHFILGFKTDTSNKGHLYGNENEKFYQKDNNFYGDTSFKNRIISINGEKPEKFLKLAIDKEGRLSYLPYLFVNEDGVDTTLTIKYEDEKERKISLSMTDYISSRDYDDSQAGVYQEKEREKDERLSIITSQGLKVILRQSLLKVQKA